MGKIVAIGGGELKDLETLQIDKEIVDDGYKITFRNRKIEKETLGKSQNFLPLSSLLRLQ